MTADNSCVGAGRFAPSPSGDLHLGNLRTYTLAWLFARSSGRNMLYRVEDIDRQRCHRSFADHQMEDLAALGLDWDGEPVFQSERSEIYEDALAWLAERGLTYNCYCTRREIQEASRAPHAIPGSYPGTCRNRTDVPPGRAPAIRLRADVRKWTVREGFACTPGTSFEGDVDDMVLRRGDGNWAYNFVVVVDDLLMGVDQIVRGDDLLFSAPRQNYLAHVLAPWAALVRKPTASTPAGVVGGPEPIAATTNSHSVIPADPNDPADISAQKAATVCTMAPDQRRDKASLHRNSATDDPTTKATPRAMAPAGSDHNAQSDSAKTASYSVIPADPNDAADIGTPSNTYAHTGTPPFSGTYAAAPFADSVNPIYEHVPLVLNKDLVRLAKRDGAVTMRELGRDTAWAWVAESLGYPSCPSPRALLESFDPDQLSHDPVIFAG